MLWFGLKARNGWALEVAATSETAQSGLYTAQSSQAASAAPIGALGTLLSGASSVGGNYAKYAQGSGTVTPTWTID
jgi:hypothetical protein